MKGKNILLNYLKEKNKFWIIKNAEHQNKNHFLNIVNSYDEIEEFIQKNLCPK
jgi:hypothetical protein